MRLLRRRGGGDDLPAGQNHPVLADGLDATALELLLVDLGVRAPAAKELRVGALLEELPAVDHEDHVRGEDGGEPVRDGDGGAPGEQWLEGGLDQALAGGVERGGRL